MHVCRIYLRAYSNTHLHTHVYTHTFTHTFTHTYTYNMYVHTNTPTLPQFPALLQHFELRCLYTPRSDRTPFAGQVDLIRCVS